MHYDCGIANVNIAQDRFVPICPFYGSSAKKCKTVSRFSHAVTLFGPDQFGLTVNLLNSHPAKMFGLNNCSGTKLLLSIVLAGGLTSCRHISQPSVNKQTAPGHSNPLFSGLDGVLWTQAAADHTALCLSIYTNAATRIINNITNKTFTAFPSQTNDLALATREPAVIFDLDETLLDNSAFQAELIRRGLDYDESVWNEWLSKAAATPLPGASNLLAFVQTKKAHIIYITNRGGTTNASQKEIARQFTLQNLRSVGFPIESDTDSLLLPGDPEKTATKSSDKTSRRKLVAEKYRIIALFGDDLGDFVSVEGKDRVARNQLISENHHQWGTGWFPLPNPLYGSWLRTLTRDLKGTPHEKQDQKLKLIKGFEP
jgi:5'-nucleotidase (lipoprotein e(P4) family)